MSLRAALRGPIPVLILMVTGAAGVASLPPPAFAQDPERPFEPRADLHASDVPDELVRGRAASAPSAASDWELDRLADVIAAAVARLYQQATWNAALAPLDCRDPVGVAVHQRALRSLGLYDDCLRWVDTCERHLAPGTRGLEHVLSGGARCASADYQMTRAHALHERATGSVYVGSEVFPGLVYVFARFAYLTDSHGEVPGILARNPAWSGAKLTLVQGALEYLETGRTALAPESAVRTEVMSWIASGDPVHRQSALVSWGWDLRWNRDLPRDSAKFFAEKAGVLRSPEEWWLTAYLSLYRAVQSGDFTPARRVYEAALPYLHPFSGLPVSYSAYTYSELYGRVCAASLTSGESRQSYDAVRREWLGGRLPTSQAYDRALRLVSDAGERADLLTLLGGLSEDLGRDDTAKDWYWRAHLACPYYNRSHNGLSNLRLRRFVASQRDRDALLEQADRETRAAPFTTDVRHFVRNWSALSGGARKQILHGLRLWARHIGFLLDADAGIYFKRVPETTSDIAGFAHLRDRRYFDNRLWDDMAGTASLRGATIDLVSAVHSPVLGGDLTAHEVAHLFHFALPVPQRACLTALYRQASARALFSSPYASTNVAEYFAVAVEVFLTPPDAPPRFGPNLGWLRRNDPDLLRLLEQIAQGRPPSALSCPVG